MVNAYAIAAAAAAGLAASAAGPAIAAPIVALDSAVYVERARNEIRGVTRSLQQADRLSRGDRIVTILRWQKQGGIGGFTVVNPLPRKVAYEGSAREDTEVSIDGGRTWGRLGGLFVGSRLATSEDVTHVRWHVAPAQAARGQGRITYSAIVR